MLCVICKYNFVSNGRSHYYPGSGCPRCKGVDFQIKYIYIYIYLNQDIEHVKTKSEDKRHIFTYLIHF